MAKAKEKPGIMVYWEMFGVLERAKPEQAQALIKAIRQYGQTGEEPNFGEDQALELVWPMLAKRITADHERWEEIKEKRTDAGRKGGLSRASKAKQKEANEANATFDKQFKPTTSTSTSTTTATSTATESIKAAKASPTRHQYGEYSNVLLSDEELGKLKAEFPSDWQSRIERLSEYIASTGKKYKSHLATIRSWAKKDKESGKGVKPDGEHKSLAEEWGGTVPKCFRTITVD